jgi:hypothetical protein
MDEFEEFEFDVSEAGVSCKYVEKEETSMGCTHYCTHEGYVDANREYFDYRVECDDPEHEPNCGHFEKRD